MSDEMEVGLGELMEDGLDVSSCKGPKDDSPEWYNLRHFEENREPACVIGASECAAALGLNKYKTPWQLYMEKRGLVEPKPETEAMEWGQYLEQPILQRYGEKVGCQLFYPHRMYLSRAMPFIVATPDAIGWDRESNDHWCVDAKNVSQWRYDAKHGRERNCFGEGEDDLPLEYVMQGQHQMLVTGLNSCDFPVLFGGQTLRMYTVQRNQELIDRLVERLEIFYQQVVDGTPPPPDFENETTLEMIKQIYPVEPVEIQLNSGVIGPVERYLKAQQEIKQAEREKAEAQAQLMFCMKEAAVAKIEGSSYTLRRTEVGPQVWTEKDVEKARKNLGQQKRKGYVRFSVSQK